LKRANKDIQVTDLITVGHRKSEKNLITFPLSEKEFKTLDIRVSKSHQSSSSDIRFLLTVHDITKEQQLEEMKLDFVSMAAHELRTPLTAIKGYISMFNEEVGAKLTKSQAMFISRINLSAEHLMALVENMLNVSRIERGVLTMEIRPTKWQPTIDEIVEELQNRAKERDISIKVIKAKNVDMVVAADKFRISQVLINLITNAINYTNPGGHIEIWTEDKGHEIITHVKDTGHGIPKEAIPHLFTKFFRVSGSLEQGSKGTGLGLYIAKSIVSSHKGKIWVESEVDKGTQFSFSIPKA
jgi:two-component system, OmpR family, phosphate regulon sensor histidine kinase PhoR